MNDSLGFVGMRHSLIVAGIAAFMTGCSHTGAIQPASSSKSGFDGAVYPGDTVEIQKPTPGIESFRLFHQGASSFVSLASVRSDIEQRASSFCSNLGKTPRYIQETASRPPHILGNFPRIELQFECADRLVGQYTETQEQNKYRKLEQLKKLLDNGALTEQEYASEKTRILGTQQP